MRYGISNLCIVPMRTEPREDSEMSSQILFGEHYTIIKERNRWCRVKLAFDGSEGWIDRKMVNEIDQKGYNQFSELPFHVVTDIVSKVNIDKQTDSFYIVAGSTLPQFRSSARSFKFGKLRYRLKVPRKKMSLVSLRAQMIKNALQYYNVPFLWGGRSPFGIDCSGFVQVIYKMAGLTLPRYAADQALLGENLSFVEEALPGDLAFFDNEDGAIVHVGIIWEDKKIIHVSGKVRIDKVDQFGIYNVETHRYTHQMRLMRRIIKDENLME